ncbi:MAG: phosphatase PAP2 family protein [Acidimicrobiales bacterium]
MGDITAGIQREHRTRLVKEFTIIGTFYLLYSLTRNRFGSISISGTDVPMNAFNNAMKVIRVERAMGLYHEESIQEWFLPYRSFLQALNTFYGTAHFAVTLTVFFVLFKYRKDVFPVFRNALAICTGLALVGFALFPLMPPRLLDAPCPGTVPNEITYGGACIPHETRNYNGATSFGFVDTLDEFGGPWDFSDGAVAQASNQYAAMPSLHIGWASWCAFGMWPLMKRRWTRAAVLLYPALTMFCIVVTGNHFWLDGLGGLLVLGLGFGIGMWIHNANQRRLNHKYMEAKLGHPAG